MFDIDCRFIRTDLTSGTFRGPAPSGSVWIWGMPVIRYRQPHKPLSRLRSARGSDRRNGVGRPPEYCDDPTLNRGAAWRALRAASAASAAIPNHLDRPVTMSQARAGAFAKQVTSRVQALTATLATVLQEFRILSDPDAAAAQLEAVTTEAEQQVATAMAGAVWAERNARPPTSNGPRPTPQPKTRMRGPR